MSHNWRHFGHVVVLFFLVVTGLGFRLGRSGLRRLGSLLFGLRWRLRLFSRLFRLLILRLRLLGRGCLLLLRNGGYRQRGPAPPAHESARLEPELLRGRVLPYSYIPIVQGDDHALISRVALAAHVPTTPEPTLRPTTQQLFEDTLGSSSLESFLHELTSRSRGRTPSTSGA